MPTVVILGGAYAGVRVAHSLLKTTAKTVKDLKVILITKNSHFYWNMASVRAVIPGQLKEEQYALPIAKGFEKYAAEQFEFIVGSAESMDTSAKTVTIKNTSTGAEQTVSYDQLVLATGSRYTDASVPWKATGTHEETEANVKRIQGRIAEAKEIVVAGAGPTGVELASEIAFEFKQGKKVILLSGDGSILGGDAVASNGMAELKKLGVEVKFNARVANTTDEAGKTEITLENGEKLTADLYLPTMGVTPNSEYVPSNLLNASKHVEVDGMYRVKGAENVWAAGDIVAGSNATYVIGDLEATGVAKNLDLVLKGKNAGTVSLMPFDVYMASTGRSRGVGRMGIVKVFSFFVYQMKGKTLGTQNLPKYVDGSHF